MKGKSTKAMEQGNKVVVQVQLLQNEDIRQFYETELRSLELDAFSNLLSALRAQGGLTERRKETIGALKIALNISDERHRAEIRRVAGDERLCRIAERVGEDAGILDWNSEGYKDFPLFPHFYQYPSGIRKFQPTTGDSDREVDSVEDEDLPPISPTIKEEPFDPSADGDFLLENGWSSDSEAEMVYATRVEREGSDTEEQKEASARATAAAAAAIRRKQKKILLSAKARNTQTSPDITMGSSKNDSKPISPNKLKKLSISPIQAAQARGRKRKFAPPVKSISLKLPGLSSEMGADQEVKPPVTPESSYANISIMADKLGIPHVPWVPPPPPPPPPLPTPPSSRGRGGKVTPRGSGRGRGASSTRGMRKTPITPRRKLSTKIKPEAQDGSNKEDVKPDTHKTPKHRLKVKLPKSAENKQEKQVRRKKLKLNIPCKLENVGVHSQDSSGVRDGSAGAPRSSLDDIDINLQCHESLNSPNPQTSPDEETNPLVNNNSEHFGNYEVAPRQSGPAPREAPPVPPPIAKPSRKAKSEVPAKMRHKAGKHNMFNHEETNKQSNFQAPDTSFRSNTPLNYAPQTNSLSPFHNYYNDLPMPLPPPGVNATMVIRSRLNTINSTPPNYGYIGGLPTGLQISRSPSRSPLPTPVFSTTLNANSLHKKRTQVLLPSTYQTQGGISGEMGLDSTSPTASSLAVAARNRSNAFDSRLGNLGLNSIRPTGSPGVSAPVQRKAQPHILSASKLNRPLATSQPVVFNSTTPPSTPGIPNNFAYNPSNTPVTSSSPPGSEVGPIFTSNVGQTAATSITFATPPSSQTQNNGVYSTAATSPNITSVQDIQTSLQSFQTGNVGPAALAVSGGTVLTTMPAGLSVNMNMVRAQGGSNIIFLHKPAAPISGTASTMPIVTPLTQGSSTIPAGVQVPVKGTSRAVILRRGNTSRAGNLMFVDVHKNQLLGASQVPQLLQTARIITSSSDLAMLNMPSIVTSSANISGRKLVQASAGDLVQHYATVSPLKTPAATDTSLLKPPASFKTIQQHQMTGGILTPSASTLSSQENQTTNYVSVRPVVNVSQTQQFQSNAEKGTPSVVAPGAPMNLVQFENDIVHEEEVNTSAFIEYNSPRSNNSKTQSTSIPSTPSNNWNLHNTATPSGSSSTDTASESESFTSPGLDLTITPSVTIGHCIPKQSVIVSTDEKRAGLSTGPISIFKAPSKLGEIQTNVDASEDGYVESTNIPISKSAEHHSSVFVVASDTSKSVN